jgi:hypothetical protein
VLRAAGHSRRCRGSSMGLTFCRRKPHACAFEACFHDQQVSTFHAAGANQPTGCLIARVLHVRLALLQVGQFLLHQGAGKASSQPGQMLEHPGWALVFEPVQHALQPASGQPPSCGLPGLPDLSDIGGGKRKVEDTHRIRTVIVDQALQPLRAILHRAHLGHLFHSPPLGFDQCCLRKALGVQEPRTGGELL